VATYLAVTAGPSATSAGTTPTSAGGLTAAATLALSVGIRLLGGVGLWLASKLNRDLAFQDLLARELSDSSLGFGGGGEVDEGVADRALGSWVLGDGDSLAKR
jgi:hypothetical protein